MYYYGGPYIVDRTYGTDKNPCIYLSLLLATKFGPIYYGPTCISRHSDPGPHSRLTPKGSIPPFILRFVPTHRPTWYFFFAGRLHQPFLSAPLSTLRTLSTVSSFLDFLAKKMTIYLTTVVFELTEQTCVRLGFFF